eukprot:CAMPEP_0173417296 /NCGR_PEP_ID=MMETSP1356-20130122/85829_1 /TAXON_ID=77927 ORGANISM="Hemiselmis virescens, Strain PCC157" /NCGR_SAMPLE_ID=MMETSP1356 /ASSEMBLY_ACC=CAM_ASM_000847 /LENGTH=79 /DNA_ID=CAMNT_0014379623 /DNA_START=868 /DNA_END=1110 /DNA_ORIENTATION=+
MLPLLHVLSFFTILLLGISHSFMQLSSALASTSPCRCTLKTGDCSYLNTATVEESKPPDQAASIAFLSRQKALQSLSSE